MAEFGEGKVYVNLSPSSDERYSTRRFNVRTECWQMISSHFSVPISSSIRFNTNDSLHNHKRGALACDFGAGYGQTKDSPAFIEEREICEWAARHPHIFQEVMHHDTGSGYHAHLAMRGGLRFMRRKVRRALQGYPRK